MSHAEPTTSGVWREEFTVPHEAIDANGHVNNVVFVQWMQDVATRHFESLCGVEIMGSAGAMWVVRSHQIEYFLPARAGDSLQVMTWVVSFSRVRSVRGYKFIRADKGQLLVRGETEWVFVNAQTGRPGSIPKAIVQAFVLGSGTDKP